MGEGDQEEEDAEVAFERKNKEGGGSVGRREE